MCNFGKRCLVFCLILLLVLGIRLVVFVFCYPLVRKRGVIVAFFAEAIAKVLLSRNIVHTAANNLVLLNSCLS